MNFCSSMRKLIALLLLAVRCTTFGQEEVPLITIADGKIRGSTNFTVLENVTYYSYRGIPYAKKPLGDLRFAPPEKNDPWTGTLDATKDKDGCVQVENGVVGSEDCLYINVYTTNVHGSLPVMVWVYGGGYVSGNSAYESNAPDYLLEKDVVFVSFNYRLGLFGFLSTEDLVAPGNWGLKDQILALKWINKNIRHFGGDPEKVTVFGQAAGAASLSYLLQSHLTKGLYRGAILQSGTALCPWALVVHAKRRVFRVGVQLGIITLSSQQLVKELRKVDAKAIALAEADYSRNGFLTENALAGEPFGVVQEVHHPGAVFTRKSWQDFNTGHFLKVPLIIGHTSNQGGFMETYLERLRPILFQYDLDLGRLAPYDLTRDWFKRLNAGAKIREHLFDSEPITNQSDAILKFLSVDMFNRPIRETVVQTSKFINAYFYEFSYKGRLGDPNNTYQGVTHAEELNYLFFTREAEDEADKAAIQKFVTLWTNFAKTGNPTPSSSSGHGSVLGDLNWKPNDSGTNNTLNIKYLNINKTLILEKNPFQSDWIFYQKLYETYGHPPYTTY